MPKKVVLLCLISALFMLLASQAKGNTIGIDVSRWQHTIDWNSVATQAGFAIIKAGGSDDGFYVDSQFERNRAEARRLGIARGYYYYAGGGDPIQEAEHFSSIVGPLEPGELVVFDYEINHDNPVVYSWQFLVRAEQILGVKPLMYTNMNRVWSHNWQPIVDNGNRLWGAIYDEDPGVAPHPGPWPDLVIKQYSSSGRIAGIDTAVDMNILRGTVAEFKALGMPAPVAPAPPPPPRVIPAVIIAPPVALEAPEPPREWLMTRFFDNGNSNEDVSLLRFEPKHPAEVVGTVLYTVIGKYLFGSDDQNEEITAEASREESGQSRTEGEAEPSAAAEPADEPDASDEAAATDEREASPEDEAPDKGEASDEDGAPDEDEAPDKDEASSKKNAGARTRVLP